MIEMNKSQPTETHLSANIGSEMTVVGLHTIHHNGDFYSATSGHLVTMLKCRSVHTAGFKCMHKWDRGQEVS